MWPFLTFETLISIPVLMAFYYFGALVLPLLLWWGMVWLRQRLAQKAPMVEQGLIAGKTWLASHLSWQSKLKWGLLFVTMFAFAELFWRLLFEFLIAFMQMRDALVTLS